MPQDNLSIHEITLYIHGKPGSGKSTFVNWLRKELPKHGINVTTKDVQDRIVELRKAPTDVQPT